MDYDDSRPIRLKAPDKYKKAEVYSPSLGALVLSESRTVVMLACFAGDLLKSEWTEVEPAPDLREVAPSQIRSREKQRQTRFFRFEKYHYERNQWIAFKRIAEWLQRAGHPPYDGLVASIHAGRFERGGKSQILFISRVAIVAPSYGPATIKGCLRFSAADFRVVDHADQDKEVLEAAYLSRFWIPRAVCEQWFIEQGYDLPAWLRVSVNPPTTKTNNDQSSAAAWPAAYQKWVQECEVRGEKPNRKRCISHMRSIFPNIKEYEVRALRRDFAPKHWTESGRPKSRRGII
jgi:hypothetical protein